MKHLALPDGFEAQLFAAEPEIGKPIRMTWDHRGRLWVAETIDYPNEMQPKGTGRDRITICRGHRRRRQGRQVHRLRRRPEHPDEPLLRQRRRDRPRRPPTRCSSRTPTATARPTCARSSSPGSGTATPTPARATCGTGSTTGSTGSSATPASRARSAASASNFRQGFYPVQARRLEARVPPQHEQQLLGRRHQRGGAALRLDGQRLPERLHADPEPLLRVGPGLIADRPGEHRRLEPLLPGHREGPPGRLARRLHRRRRLGALHGPDLPEAVLEPDRVRRRADRAPRRHVHAAPGRHRLPLAQRLEPGRQRRRMDLADPGRGRPRRATSG